MDERLAAHLELARLTDEEYVERLYLEALRRPPEADARERALRQLRDGSLSRATLLHELATSQEFVHVRALDDAVARATGARARNERPRALTAPPGTSERAIETGWTLSRYRGERRVLDVGYANAEPAYVAALLAAAPPGAVTGVDLAGADVPGLTPVRADLRKLPFGRRSFDVVFCISTLEHVGFDNTLYGVEGERDPRGIPTALRELRRVLTRGGRVLITVPCGENEDRGWFVQREPDAWTELFLSAGFAVHEQEVYELRDEGWRSVEEPSRGLRYGTRGPAASAVLCAELRRRRLFRLRGRGGLRFGRDG